MSRIARLFQSTVRVSGFVFLFAPLILTSCSSTPEAREAKYMRRGASGVADKDYKKALIEFKVASQNMPKDAEPVYQLGMTYLKAGDAGRAVQAFIKTISLNPNHAGAQYEIALTKAGSSKPELVEESVPVLAARVKGNPSELEALGALALAKAKLGDPKEALQLLLAYSEKNPPDLHPARLVVAVYASREDTASAIELARALAEHVPKSPDAAVLQAEVLLATKNNAAADDEINRALALKRDDLPALELRLHQQLADSDRRGAEQTAFAVAGFPDRRLWAIYAHMLFADRKFDQGIEEYERVLRLHGDPSALRADYVQSLMSAGRIKEAETAIAGTLKKYPKDPDALTARAGLEIGKGELETAAGDIRTLREMKAPSAGVSYEESRIFAARGDTVRQGDLLTEALQRSPRLMSARLALSELLVKGGKAKNALLILDHASAEEKATTGYIYFHNMALFASGQWDEARKGVEAGLAMQHLPGFFYQDAALRTRSRDLDGARKAIESALQLIPGDPLGWALLGDTMRLQSNFAKYIPLLKDAATKSPPSPRLQKMLGVALLQAGDRTGARAAFEALRAAGGRTEADPEIAALDIQAGALDAAKQRLVDLVKAHDNIRSRLLLGEIELRKGSPDAAMQQYMSAMKLAPANSEAMNDVAELLAAKGRYDDALYWGEKALAASPGNPVILDTIGWTYYREGKYDTALPYLDKSLRGRERPLAHYHYAAGLLKTGDRNGAKKEFETAVKLDPQSTARLQVAPLFEGAGRSGSR